MNIQGDVISDTFYNCVVNLIWFSGKVKKAHVKIMCLSVQGVLQLSVINCGYFLHDSEDSVKYI